MTIEFPDDLRRQMHEALQSYFREHFDHDLGVLQTDMLFEFLLGLVGSGAYNQGIADAQAYLQTKLVDLEIDLHETVEFGK